MSSKSLTDHLSYVGSIVIATPVIAVAIVVAPVIGLLAQPILATQALYYAISQKFHFNRTKDENGVALSEDIDPLTTVPRYMDWEKKDFSTSDLTRLKHERDRLKAINNISDTWVSVKKFAKLMIPVLGLKWHFEAERENLKSTTLDPLNFYGDLRALNYHIANIEKGEKLYNKLNQN
jgi:hypothetical protein